MDPHGLNVTGIPTDLLLIGFGTVIFAIQSWAVRELVRMARHANTTRYVMKLVCQKLDIPYPNGE